MLRQIFLQGKTTAAQWYDLLENHLVILTMLTKNKTLKLSWQSTTFCLQQIWQWLSVWDIKAMPVKRQCIKTKIKTVTKIVSEKKKQLKHNNLYSHASIQDFSPVKSTQLKFFTFSEVNWS